MGKNKGFHAPVIPLFQTAVGLPALERFPKGVTRLSDKKRDQQKIEIQSRFI
jgi:hypothetical protein